ncbi:MAG: hypothetical protein KAY32_17810 [Candidatus Eisenbacteria sp.]|nr:hypothetical protein [Candidatus Eisenbacteria bacterium]
MPLDVPAELLTASSGSAGDVVHTRNQHGRYVKPRVVPADPATALQVAVRNHLAECVAAWNATLTQPERAAWERYARALRLTGPTGRRNNVGGLPTYIRSNVPRLQAAGGSIGRVDEAPTLHDLAPFTPVPRVVLNVVDDTFHPFFAESDAWVGESGAAMLFYVSAPRPLSVNFWNGPYKYAGRLTGGDPALSSPATLPLPTGADLGERVFIRLRVTRNDARLSQPVSLPANVVPQVAPVFTDASFAQVTPTRFTLTVNFDALLRRQVHASGVWFFRYMNWLHYPFLAVTSGNAIVLTTLTGPPNPGPDAVWYQPPPSDVYGLLTGLPVAGFVAGF